MSDPILSESESERDFYFHPRKIWETGRAFLSDVGLISDTEESDGSAPDSMTSGSSEDDSICSFLSVLDENNQIATSLHGTNNDTNVKKFDPDCLLIPSPTPAPSPPPPVPSHATKAAKQDTTLNSHGSRRARDSDFDFTIPTEMERSFLRNSRIAHGIQSNAELKFHRYIDRLEEQMLRERPPTIHHANEDEGDELTNDDHSPISDPQQQLPLLKIHHLPPTPTSTPFSSPASTIIEEPYMPFNNDLALARCNKVREHEPAYMSLQEPQYLTPERRTMHSPPSPSSIWPSPSSAGQTRNGRAVAWWVAVPAASESGGEVWEDIDEVWRARHQERDGGEGDVSTFTAREEDLEDDDEDDDDDEKVEIGGIGKKESKCKRRWGRCRKLVKRVLRSRR